jgi:hypothetical protein
LIFMVVYASSVSETVTSAPSEIIQGTKISRHLSGSCPIHPPQTKITFLPDNGENPPPVRAFDNRDGVTIAAAVNAALLVIKDLRDTIIKRF